MALNRQYATEDEIPEAERGFYTQQGEVFILDIEGGLKTEKDVERIDIANRKEREAHRKTKDRLKAFGDLTPEAIQALRDEADDLRIQVEAGGKPDEATLEKLVERRAEAKLRPLQRELKAAQDDVLKLRDENGRLGQDAARRRRSDTLRAATIGTTGIKLRHPSVLEDVELMAERHLVEDESGSFVTRDGLGQIPAGLSPSDWLKEIYTLGTRPHWFPENEGAGAEGGKKPGIGGGPDPFVAGVNGTKATVNMTEFGKLVRSDPKRARALAQKYGRADLLPTIPPA